MNRLSTYRGLILSLRLCMILSLLLTSSLLHGSNTLLKSEVKLANNAILSICQDSDSNMWIGTYDGLHLYDSKDTYVYRMNFNDENSLSSNIIEGVIRTDDNHLLVATSLSVNIFSLEERRVTKRFDHKVEAQHIASDGLGRAACLYCADCIAYYSPELGQFKSIYVPNVNFSEVISLWFSRSDVVSLLYSDGTVVNYAINETQSGVDIREQSKEHISKAGVYKASLVGESLYYADSENHVWSYNISTGRVAHLSDLSPLGAVGERVSSISPFEESVYVGFYSGALAKFPRYGGRSEIVNSEYRIFCLLADQKQDILWVGTDGYGVHMYCDKVNYFHTLRLKDMLTNVNKPVRGGITDSEGNLLIGTKGGGAIHITSYEDFLENPDPAAVRHYNVNNGLTSNEVYGFCHSVRPNITWVNTFGPGLSYFDRSTKQMYRLENSVDEPVISTIHQMCEVDANTLYLSADGKGLVEVKLNDSATPSVKSVSLYEFEYEGQPCNRFYAILKESESTLLLGMLGGYGVIRFYVDSKEYEFMPLDNLNDRGLSDILSLCQSDRTKLYCGTSSGLLTIDDSGVVEQFDSRDGIVNDMIHGVLEDDSGYVWLSTNSGLTQYNPHNRRFHNYLLSEGGVFEFCDDAYWKCPYTDKIFFGAVNGIVWKDHYQANDTHYSPELRFKYADLSTGEHIPINNSGAVNSEPLRIPSSVSEFSISFIAVDYLDGEDYEYSYQLQGYSEEWVELQKSNSVTFTDLPPGCYTLSLRYKSDVVQPLSQIYSMTIDVKGPWYKSLWAMVLYVLFAAGCISMVVMSVRRSYRRHREKMLSTIEREQRDILHKARLNFFENISHELCTPLTLIRGVNEKIKEHTADDEEMSRYTDVMSSNVESLNELISEILEFRKIEGEELIRPNYQCIDVESLIDGVVRSTSEAAERAQVSIFMECAAPRLWVVDKTFLKKILNNLLSNALKYTHSGGMVWVSVAQHGTKLQIKVRNSGKGISQEKIATIFDRYKTFEKMESNMYSDLTTRHGLGLYICKSLVEKMEGEISASSKEGEYTEFVVTLPSHEDIFGVTSPAPSAPLQSEMSGGKPVVLVVDDNKDVVWLISSTLQDSYRVVSANSVAEAKELLGKLSPSLIVTDIVMPDESGLELIRYIRGSRYHRALPIVVVSAKVTDSEKIEGVESGADVYLTKPFSSPLLLTTVKRLIENRESVRSYLNAPESAYVVDQSGESLHQDDKEFLDSVVAIIGENVDNEELSVELLAEKLSLTSRTLSRKVKSISGRTPSELIKSYRYDHAARLLITTNLTIQEIMYRVGISNKSYFYREFQNKFHMKPKEYRELK